ncbi:MAG: DedA family protein [Deltaproteobacteria bacterium]|jgi:membrane-associated protein|nr:DedA family protein [Deltaproteobacteria bacterium]
MEPFSFLSDGAYGLIDFILHIDVHLDALVSKYGWQTYLILFVIVFWETGVVIFPFLPGDSLLFAAGAIAHRAESPLSLGTLFLVIASAAFLGDTFNYWIGRFLGPKVLNRDGRFLKRKYLDATRDFYERHGVITIVLARFVPIVRTFAPFVAGVGQMFYPRFMIFNLLGGVLWSAIFLSAGYLFGGLPFVRKNFTMVIMAIIVLSVMPMVVEYFKNVRGKAKKAASKQSAETLAEAATEVAAEVAEQTDFGDLGE